jgi:hypothetical protein
MAVHHEPRPKPKFGAKSEFVRSLPRDIPAAKVVALAQERGLQLTTGFVYNIRSSRKVNGEAQQAKRPSQAKALSPEAVLRAAIAQIGLVRAREILEKVEETFAGE